MIFYNIFFLSLEMKIRVYIFCLSKLQRLANSEKDISEDLALILKNLSGLTDTVNADTSVSTMTQLVDTAQNVVSVVETSDAITEQGTTVRVYSELLFDVSEAVTLCLNVMQHEILVHYVTLINVISR